MRKKLAERAKNTLRFLNFDLWSEDLDQYGRFKGTFLKLVKIIIISVTGFFKDNCTLRASALTYSLTMAIVPLFAVLFSVLKGFGFQNKLANVLLTKLTAGSDLVINGILSYINNTSVQTLGALGGVILLLTSVFLFMGIERTFNDIWKVKADRPFIRRILDYLVIILVLPIFITVAIGVTAGNILTLDFVKALLAYPLIEFLISSFLPYLFMWIAFTLMYYFLVNHKVPFLAAFVGGIVAGTTWQIGQEFYIHFSHTVNRYNIIYGGFAQLILVFLWLYISWIIILAGMELVYAIVNYRAYQKEGKYTMISPSFKEKLVLIIMAIIVRRFKHGKPPISTEGILKMTNAPRRAVYDLLQELKDLMLVMESEQKGIKVYTPGMDTELLTVPRVLKLVREYGVNHVPMLDEEDGKKVDKLMRDINVLLEKDFNAVKISDL